MLPIAKFLPYLALLIPLHVASYPQYNSKNIPLAYGHIYKQGNLFPYANYLTTDMLVCTPHYFPKRVFRDKAYLDFPLGHYAKSKHSDKSITSVETFNFDNQGAFSSRLTSTDVYAYSGAWDKRKTIGFLAYYSFNYEHLMGRYDQEIVDYCYTNVFTDFSRVEFSQVEGPVSPVPELPQSALLIFGLGFMIFAQRHKLFI